MRKHVTVYDPAGLAISLFAEVAAELGYKYGQVLSYEEARRAVHTNASAGLFYCSMMKELEQKQEGKP